MEINQWLKLVEYGDHPHPEGIQRVSREAAEEMQRKFRSLRARLARKFGGVPIYIGHPDDKNFSFLPGHSDTRSYAWVQDIEAREDGIWILPRWSDAGKTMVESSFFKFLSPRWEMKREGHLLIPIRLISVGLTNNPNILGDAIANQSVPGDPVADSDDFVGREGVAAGRRSPQAVAEGEEAVDQMAERRKNKRSRKAAQAAEREGDQGTERNSLQWRINDLLARLFGVDFTQTWEEIEENLVAKAECARLWCEEGESLKNSNRDLLSESERFYKVACEKELQVQQLGEQLNAAKDLSGEHFVNFAINRGLILPNEAGTWKEKYIADPRGASNELLKQTCSLNTTSQTEHLRQSSNPRGKERILALVNGRMEANGESYAEAWSAVKKIYPTLF
jgi:hypothetical protein